VGDTLNRVARGIDRSDIDWVRKVRLVQVNQGAMQTNYKALTAHLRAMDRGFPNHQIEVKAVRTTPTLMNLAKTNLRR
jgi:hypothetical protein